MRYEISNLHELKTAVEEMDDDDRLSFTMPLMFGWRILIALRFNEREIKFHEFRIGVI